MHRSENERSFENFEALLRMGSLGSLPTLLFPDTRTQTSIGGYYNYNNNEKRTTVSPRVLRDRGERSNAA